MWVNGSESGMDWLLQSIILIDTLKFNALIAVNMLFRGNVLSHLNRILITIYNSLFGSSMWILLFWRYYFSSWSYSCDNVWTGWGNTLQWRHNGHNGVSNHQPHHCLHNRLFRRRTKKTPKLRATGLCTGNSPMTGEFPAQRGSDEKMLPFDDVIMILTCVKRVMQGGGS